MISRTGFKTPVELQQHTEIIRSIQSIKDFDWRKGAQRMMFERHIGSFPYRFTLARTKLQVQRRLSKQFQKLFKFSEMLSSGKIMIAIDLKKRVRALSTCSSGSMKNDLSIIPIARILHHFRNSNSFSNLCAGSHSPLETKFVVSSLIKLQVVYTAFAS